ncbi:MAG: hypothetical protein QGF00_11700 [Planctomycetota bacterium]|jgi:hypothetical protein|nr:hypothetical protein [Planctomycetota bacterium]MDP7250256.1 hypothetical protein [Planctomycetota bacterium]|tara:strand:- start:289 stop:717 length:429 start_codon:yes stop_codon:yes gene_type:complete
MANIPDSVKKRDILYGDSTDPEELSELGGQYLAEERFWEAVEFYDAAKDDTGIAKVKNAGIEMADSYLLRRLEKMEIGNVTESDWLSLAENALTAEKIRDAIEGFERGGQSERAEDLWSSLNKIEEVSENEGEEGEGEEDES